MNVIPAQIAQVESIAIVTPCDKDGRVNPLILAAANILGATEIYKVGGAQAIGALAYGTSTIKPVNKIVGPGNIYVARAKRAVFGLVDIDMIAGPSEICVIADQSANPKFVAADLLSQAEHDEMASAVLVTHSREVALKSSEKWKISQRRVSFERTSSKNHFQIRLYLLDQRCRIFHCLGQRTCSRTS
jgi:histidinol dehydrogenase